MNMECKRNPFNQEICVQMLSRKGIKISKRTKDYVAVSWAVQLTLPSITFFQCVYLQLEYWVKYLIPIKLNANMSHFHTKPLWLVSLICILSFSSHLAPNGFICLCKEQRTGLYFCKQAVYARHLFNCLLLKSTQAFFFFFFFFHFLEIASKTDLFGKLTLAVEWRMDYTKGEWKAKRPQGRPSQPTLQELPATIVGKFFSISVRYRRGASLCGMKVVPSLQ